MIICIWRYAPGCAFHEIERLEGDEETLKAARLRLLDYRQAADDGVVISLFSAATAENIDSRIAAAIERIDREAAILASLPPVLGETEISKAQWDAAMATMSPWARGKAANLAAHSWAVVPHPEGLLALGHGHYGTIITQDREYKAPDDQIPKLCHNCVYTQRYLATRGDERPLICTLGNPDYRQGVNRRVGRTNFCDGWRQELPEDGSV